MERLNFHLDRLDESHEKVDMCDSTQVADEGVETRRQVLEKVLHSPGSSFKRVSKEISSTPSSEARKEEGKFAWQQRGSGSNYDSTKSQRNPNSQEELQSPLIPLLHKRIASHQERTFVHSATEKKQAEHSTCKLVKISLSRPKNVCPEGPEGRITEGLDDHLENESHKSNDSLKKTYFNLDQDSELHHPQAFQLPADHHSDSSPVHDLNQDEKPEKKQNHIDSIHDIAEVLQKVPQFQKYLELRKTKKLVIARRTQIHRESIKLEKGQNLEIPRPVITRSSSTVYESYNKIYEHEDLDCQHRFRKLSEFNGRNI